MRLLPIRPAQGTLDSRPKSPQSDPEIPLLRNSSLERQEGTCSAVRWIRCGACVADLDRCRPMPLPTLHHRECQSNTRSNRMNSPHNPYLAARREWDERYGDFITRAKNWRTMAAFSSLIALVATVGIVWLS